jgi:exonuclease VII large subunit
LISKKKNNLALKEKIISSNNIDHILSRGFAIVEQNKKIVKRKIQFIPETEFDLTFSDGKVKIVK